jgi:tRNA (cmo5U34)-methyltransferase
MSERDLNFSLIHTPDGQTRPDEQADKKFSFTNFSKEFDDHIDRSIRGYSTLRTDVVSLSRYFVENDTTVLDLGCSQGSLIRRMYENNDHVRSTEYIGVELNDSFQEHWKEEEQLKYIVDDITTMEFPKNLSLVTSLFTFQFIPERKRVHLMEKIYENLIEGGAFVFSEKLLSIGGKVQNMMEFMYYDYKREHFTEKEILDKEIELRHLAKLTNEDLLIKQLLGVGFRQIQTFWRNFNFVGMVALKIPSNNWDKK